MSMNDQAWVESKNDSACPHNCAQVSCDHWERNGVAARWRADQDPAKSPGLDRGR